MYNRSILKFDNNRQQFIEELHLLFQSLTPVKSILRLTKLAEKCGLSPGSGYINFKQLTDLAEFALNSYLIKIGIPYRDQPTLIKYLSILQDVLPTETERTREQLEYQQFSTPLPLAYELVRCAAINKSDVVLEPSAGTGTLAAFALAYTTNVHVNELSNYRKFLLQHSDYTACTCENAAHLHHIDHFLKLNPSIVVMNPPFARAAERLKRKRSPLEAAEHIESALHILRHKGRLVTLTSKGMSFESRTFKKWWTKINNEFDVKANYLLDGSFFLSKGTKFQTRLIVIDKVFPTGTLNTGLIKNLSQLSETVNHLSKIR